MQLLYMDIAKKKFISIKLHFSSLSNVRDTIFFFSNYWYDEWLLVNEKIINGGPKWKPIRSGPYQQFVKIL